MVVVPAARARHREELSSRRPVENRRRLFARHRLRTMLICYGPFHLVRVLPQAVVFTLIEVVYALAAGRVAQSVDVLGAWSWNLRRLGEIRSRRRALRDVRGLRDAEVRLLQGRGSARVTSFLRGELGRGDRVRTSLSEAGRGLAGSLRAGPARLAIVAWVIVAALMLVGTRELIGERLPAFAGLAQLDRGPLSLLREYASGWRSAGLGSQSPAPSAFALLGLAGTVLLGAMGVLQQLLVLGMLPVGLVGLWYLTRPLGSPRARAVGLVVYAVSPLPYDALARGRWDGLLLYAAAPWILARLLAATGDEPFGARPGARRVHVGLALGPGPGPVARTARRPGRRVRSPRDGDRPLRGPRPGDRVAAHRRHPGVDAGAGHGAGRLGGRPGPAPALVAVVPACRRGRLGGHGRDLAPREQRPRHR